jgi:hypothetical protein
MCTFEDNLRIIYGNRSIGETKPLVVREDVDNASLTTLNLPL